MNRDNFLVNVKDRTDQRMKLLLMKGIAYSGNSDAFENFKRNGEKLGLTKYQIWAVYCSKHLDAIFNAIKANPLEPVDKSEGLQGRIDDAINYLELFSGMLKEDENNKGIIAGSDPINRWKRALDSGTAELNRTKVERVEDGTPG